MATRMLRGDDSRVGFAELLYDLIFVFAITQISHHLLHHYSLTGAGQTAFLFMAVWWVWICTIWAMNRLDPDRPQVRGLLFGLMVAGLFLSMSLPDAFQERGLIFALAYVVMQIGRNLFMIVAARDEAVLRRTFFRIMPWFTVSGLFWVAGGLAHPDTRIWFWGAALGIEYLGPMVGFWVPRLGRDVSTDWAVRGGHMAERCGLFVIICLGEAMLVSGATFASMEWYLSGMLSFLGAVAVAGSVAMWWVYFHIGHKRGSHQIEHAGDPGRLARLAFTYLHIPVVAGIVLAAVGSERAIAHPNAIAVLAECASVVGGVALFLLGNGLFKWVSANNFPLSHQLGIALCLGLTMIGAHLTLWQVNALAAVILVVVALCEQWSFGGSDQSSQSR